MIEDYRLEVAEIVSRQRPLQSAAAQAVDSLFADAPAAVSDSEAADELAISLWDEGHEGADAEF